MVTGTEDPFFHELPAAGEVKLTVGGVVSNAVLDTVTPTEALLVLLEPSLAVAVMV